MSSSLFSWKGRDEFVENTQKKSVSIHVNGDFENGKVIYVEPDWGCLELLNAASKRLDIFPSAKRVFNANGVEIDDCIMIEDDDILFLSNGENFIAPTVNGSSEVLCSNSARGDKIPASLGGFEVGKLLGRGGFGEVRVGKHQLTGEMVALKFLKKSEIMSIGMAERTITEIQCLTALKHPNIISLVQNIESTNHVVLVFELMEGGDLASFMKKRGDTPEQAALTEDEARGVFHQVLAGLSFAHNRHICHRDLKLENLLLKENSLACVKIADFGLSDFYRPGSTRKSSCGTLSFLAPEVFRGTANAGPPLDVWALGVVLFATLCGRLPFEGTDFSGAKRPRDAVIKSRILKGQYRIEEDIGPEAKDLVRRLLKPDPADRTSVPEIFNHPWLKSFSPFAGILSPFTKSKNNEFNSIVKDDDRKASHQQERRNSEVDSDINIAKGISEKSSTGNETRGPSDVLLINTTGDTDVVVPVGRCTDNSPLGVADVTLLTVTDDRLPRSLKLSPSLEFLDSAVERIALRENYELGRPHVTSPHRSPHPSEVVNALNAIVTTEGYHHATNDEMYIPSGLSSPSSLVEFNRGRRRLTEGQPPVVKRMGTDETIHLFSLGSENGANGMLPVAGSQAAWGSGAGSSSNSSSARARSRSPGQELEKELAAATAGTTYAAAGVSTLGSTASLSTFKVERLTRNPIVAPMSPDNEDENGFFLQELDVTSNDHPARSAAASPLRQKPQRTSRLRANEGEDGSDSYANPKPPPKGALSRANSSLTSNAANVTEKDDESRRRKTIASPSNSPAQSGKEYPNFRQPRLNTDLDLDALTTGMGRSRKDFSISPPPRTLKTVSHISPRSPRRVGGFDAIDSESRGVSGGYTGTVATGGGKRLALQHPAGGIDGSGGLSPMLERIGRRGAGATPRSGQVTPAPSGRFSRQSSGTLTDVDGIAHQSRGPRASASSTQADLKGNRPNG